VNVLDTCLAQIRGRGLRVVFPEGADERIVVAAQRLYDEGLAEAILVENPESSGRLDAYAALYLQGRSFATSTGTRTGHAASGQRKYRRTPVPRCLRQASNQAPSSLPVPRLRGRD
jgi:hypothetical protein